MWDDIVFGGVLLNREQLEDRMTTEISHDFGVDHPVYCVEIENGDLDDKPGSALDIIVRATRPNDPGSFYLSKATLMKLATDWWLVVGFTLGYPTLSQYNRVVFERTMVEYESIIRTFGLDIDPREWVESEGLL